MVAVSGKEPDYAGTENRCVPFWRPRVRADERGAGTPPTGCVAMRYVTSLTNTPSRRSEPCNRGKHIRMSDCQKAIDSTGFTLRDEIEGRPGFFGECNKI